MKKLRVLVVEDEPLNREIAEIILTSHGHEVVAVENGQEALDLCHGRGERFDVILMDILMPVMDGLEATRALRAHAGTVDTPIICISAKASGSDRGAGFAAGCDCYLNKPYKRKDLMAVLVETLVKKGVLEPEETLVQD